jgi:hypothetical protein
VVQVNPDSPGDSYVRSTPSRSRGSSILLVRGSDAAVIDGLISNEGYDWYEVQFSNGQTGFIANNPEGTWLNFASNAQLQGSIFRCENCNLHSLVEIGDTAFPSYNEGNSTLRDSPGGNGFMDIPEGATFTVIDGPTCTSNGIMWFRVDYQGNSGWISQGNDQRGYWITLND